MKSIPANMRYWKRNMACHQKPEERKKESKSSKKTVKKDHLSVCECWEGSLPGKSSKTKKRGGRIK